MDVLTAAGWFLLAWLYLNASVTGHENTRKHMLWQKPAADGTASSQLIIVKSFMDYNTQEIIKPLVAGRLVHESSGRNEFLCGAFVTVPWRTL